MTDTVAPLAPAAPELKPTSLAKRRGGVPLDSPAYRVSVISAVWRFFAKYVTFTGRASRSEYWRIALIGAFYFAIVAYLFETLSTSLNVVTLCGHEYGCPPVTHTATVVHDYLALLLVVALVAIATLLPSISLTVRRLHDVNRSGHCAWILLIPALGLVIVMIACLFPAYQTRES